MLTSLLDSIGKQLGSKSYWLASMLPLILFLAASAAVCPQLAEFLKASGTWDQKTSQYFTGLLILLSLAYLLSTLGSVMLRLLEGRIGPLSWPWLSKLFCPRIKRQLRKLDRDYRHANDELMKIQKARTNWDATLKSSMLAGKQQPALDNAGQASWPTTRAGKSIADIIALQDGGDFVRFEELDRAVMLLAVELSNHRTGASGILADAFIDLQAAIQYAMDRRQFEKRRLYQQRQANFPGVRPTSQDQEQGPVSNSILAPTKMGNIGRTIGTYTLVRYGMDLDIFWSRLQNSLQKDGKEYYTVLSDSKVQVDAMVTLCCLSVVYSIVWTVALLFFRGTTVRQFLTVGIAGPVCAVAFYALACESYRVFADVLRSCVDLFRFQVLTALHLPLPADSNDEKDLWLRLGVATGFMDPEDFQYQHK
jgi:hypothetical protein